MEGRGRHRRLSPFVQPRSLPRAPWSVNVTTPLPARHGGQRRRLHRVPGQCRISLILKLLPGESLDDAARELEEAVRTAPVDPAITLAFDYPAGRDHRFGGTPTETSPDLPFVRLLTEAVRAVRPDRGKIEGAPYWSEAPFLVEELGVPTVYCAPGDIRNCHTLEERVEVQEYLDGIVAFAVFLARLGELQHPLK